MRVLYLSYDGMTDPLGSSQVIPYLRGLARHGHRITILSAEKPERRARLEGEIGAGLERDGLGWEQVPYHKRPPMLSTVWDARRMAARARELVRSQGIELVHCRSYVPSLVGLELKRRLGARFLFDMRGFWADERVDGGLWDLRRPHYRLAYRFFKRKERRFLEESDAAVSLTHAGLREMGRWGLSPEALGRIEVIPCCADLEHFDRARVSEAARARLRAELGLRPEDFVVCYLGSVGTWYCLDEMLRFFTQLRAQGGAYRDARLLFVTPDAPAGILERARACGADPAWLRIREGTRAEVPALLSLARLGLFFIKPAYSKLSSSPTKLAELLAMGIPVVTNRGVGDSEWLSERFRFGETVKDFTPGELGRAIKNLPECLRLPPEEIRAAAASYFSLSGGVEAYQRIYTRLGALVN